MGVKFAPLDSDEGYDSWKMDMEALLVIKGCDDVIEDRDRLVLTADELRRDKQARAYIVSNVCARIKKEIGGLPTARQMWTRLEERYRATMTARRMRLQRELTDISMQQGEGIDVYFSRARGLIADLRAAGDDVTEDVALPRILEGLTEDFASVVDYVILNLDTLRWNWDAAVQHLLEAEARQHRRATGGVKASDAALQAQSRTQGRREERTCFFCGKKGHIKKDCRKYQEYLKKRQHDGHDRPARPRHSALSAMRRGSDSERWIVDSGATDHMTNRGDILHDYTALKDARAITCADGKSATAVGYGNLYATTPDGESLMFKKVLYVPKIACNLLSAGRIDERGGQILTSRGVCRVSVDGKVLLTARRDSGGLYSVRLRATVPKAHAMTAATTRAPLRLWHARLGHVGVGAIRELHKKKMVKGLEIDDLHDSKDMRCEVCPRAKLTQSHFAPSTSKATRPMELVHSDVMQMPVPSLGGARYVVTLLDDYSRLSSVTCVARKSMTAAVVADSLDRLEAMSGRRTKTLRSDNGGEYMSKEFNNSLRKRGVTHQVSAPYTPQQNGRAERLNRTLMERVRAMLAHSGQPQELWAEAVTTANYIRNRCPATTSERTPYEDFTGKKPKVDNLRVFGCRAFVFVPAGQRNKLQDRARQGVFVGYASDAKAWRVLVDDNRIVTSANVLFHEDMFDSKDQVSDHDDDDDSDDGHRAGPPATAAGDVDEEMQEPDSDGAGNDAPEDDKDEDYVMDEAQGEAEEDEQGTEFVHNRFPKRNRRPPVAWYQVKAQAHAATAADDGLPDDPATLEQALNQDDAELWRQAADEELTSLQKMGVYELVEKPASVQPLKCKWVLKRKRAANGSIERYKARLVAKGFSQRHGIDYDEVFAPVARHATLRALLAVAAERDLEIEQVDVKTAFLNGRLEEDIYMEAPSGYDFGGKVMRLHRALYGLKQAARAWNERLKESLQQRGFTMSDADASLFTLKEGGRQAYLLIYVDDALICGHRDDVDKIVEMLATDFDIRKLGAAQFFLGMEITRDRGSKTLTLSQKKYASQILERNGMRDAKPRSVPMDANTRLSRDGEDCLEQGNEYAELLGMLLYLSSCTRPDIAFAVGLLARFMSKPRREHLAYARGILHYLKKTEQCGITFSGSMGLELIGYSDADYAADPDKRRTTGGHVFTMAGGAISWASKLLPTVATSTLEAEYMATAWATKELLWLRKLMATFQGSVQCGILRCDNQGALALMRNPTSHARAKHIDVCHHFVRERVSRGDLKVEYCQTGDMIADIMTKALTKAKHEKFMAELGVGHCP